MLEKALKALVKPQLGRHFLFVLWVHTVKPKRKCVKTCWALQICMTACSEIDHGLGNSQVPPGDILGPLTIRLCSQHNGMNWASHLEKEWDHKSSIFPPQYTPTCMHMHMHTPNRWNIYIVCQCILIIVNSWCLNFLSICTWIVPQCQRNSKNEGSSSTLLKFYWCVYLCAVCNH